MIYEDVVRGFLKDCELSGKSRKTVSTYQFALEAYGEWLKAVGTDYLTVNGRETKAFRNHLAEKGMKSKSINLVISALSSFYSYLVDEGLLKGNPVQTKKLRVKEEQDLPKFLTDEEIGKVREFFKDKPEYLRLAFDAMLFAGLRIAEVDGMGPEDVIVEKGRVFLRVKGKGNKERLAPIVNPQVAKEIVALAKNTPKENYLFASYANLEWWSRQCRLATGVHLTPHRLRHTYATRLLACGHGIDVIQEALGHASITTTRKYARTLPERLFQVAAACS